MSKRPYFFEIFTLVNFLVAWLVLRQTGISAFLLLDQSFRVLGPALALQAAIGIAIRAVIGRRRGGDYLAVIRTPRFLTDLLRMIVVSVLWAHTYGWLKVAVPMLNRRLYDEVFWNLDRALFFGMSPNIFFLDLFSHPLALRAVDWSYANTFAATLFIGGAFFFSHPDPRLRIGFVNANAALWLIGGWLYVAFPALDPCYRFPSIWLPLAEYLPQTQFLQRLLMTNYRTFIGLAMGQPGQINLLLGLSAFPSLHVACAFLTYLWMRGQAHGWRILMLVFTIVIFVGSLVTGWHYLVDGLAGLVLAALCYAAFHLLPKRFERHAGSH
jgi:membrane-associated phospholipid phosphatase